jgi:transcriptional regulator with XRE-family HTH domain
MVYRVKQRKAQPLLLEDFEDEFEFELGIFQSIKSAREKQGLSQRQLAQKIGIPQSSLARLESGKYFNPTLTFLKKVIMGLGLELTVHEAEKVKAVI